MNAGILGTWWLTFALHSTVAIVLIGALQWLLARRKLPHVEPWWRLALLGPLLSASVHVFAPAGTPGLRLLLPGGETAAELANPTVTDPSVPDDATSPTDALDSTESTASNALSTSAPHRSAPVLVDVVPGTSRSRIAGDERPRDRLARRRAAPAPPVWRAVAPWIAWVVSAFVVWSTLRAIVSARRALQGRTPAQSRFALDLLQEMVERAGLRRSVRLTMGPNLRTPVSFGVLRPEICLPSRALHRLDPRGLRCVLAHEIAHLRRRDPLWSWVYLLARGLTPVQPLQVFVLRRLHRLAERACDEWAAAATGRPLDVAATLAAVAAWVTPTRVPIGLPAMATPGRALSDRIEHLLHLDEAGPHSSRSLQRVRSTLALLAALFLLPAFAESGSGPVPTSSIAVGSSPRAGGDEHVPLPILHDLVAAELRRLRSQIHGLRLDLEKGPDDPEVRASLEDLQRRSEVLARLFEVASSRQATGRDRSEGRPPTVSHNP